MLPCTSVLRRKCAQVRGSVWHGRVQQALHTQPGRGDRDGGPFPPLQGSGFCLAGAGSQGESEAGEELVPLFTPFQPRRHRGTERLSNVSGHTAGRWRSWV